MLFLLLLVLGIITGILAGLFGIGGGTLFTPILFIVFSSLGVENVVPWTIGTSLFCTFTAALSSTIQQFTEKNSYLIEGAKVGIFGAVGVYAGKLVVTSDFYTEMVFVTVFAILLLFVSIMFLRRGKSNKTIATSLKNVGIKPSSLTGGGGGFIAALAGVGGGAVIVPVLNLGYKLPILKAVSISSLAVLLISLSGWLQFAFLSGTVSGITNYTIGFVDFGTGLPLILGAFAGGLIGVRVGRYFTQSRLQIGFSILAFFVAVLMVWSVL